MHTFSSVNANIVDDLVLLSSKIKANSMQHNICVEMELFTGGAWGGLVLAYALGLWPKENRTETRNFYWRQGCLKK